MTAQGEALGNGRGPSSVLKGRTNRPTNAAGQYALTGLVWMRRCFPQGFALGYHSTPLQGFGQVLPPNRQAHDGYHTTPLQGFGQESR